MTPAELAAKMRAANEALSGLGSVSAMIPLAPSLVQALAAELGVPVERKVHITANEPPALLEKVALGRIEAHAWSPAKLADCIGAEVRTQARGFELATADEIAAAFDPSEDHPLVPFCPRCGLQPSAFTGCDCGKEARL